MVISEKISILICDDDSETRRVIRHSLSPFNYDIEEAEDGAVAIEKCLKKLPHLIITDVMMPNVTGIQLVKWVRTELSSGSHYIPILMLTALDDLEQKIAGLEIGADEYISKPFHYRELQARVQGLIRVKELTEKLIERNDELSALNRMLGEMQAELVKREREIVAAQLVGTAAHNLGQPVTAILLNCHLAERLLPAADGSGVEAAIQLDPGVRKAIKAIRDDGEKLRQLLHQLTQVDPEQRENYLSGVDILRLDGGGVEKKI